MANSIQELKKMILNPDIKLSVVLQHALVVANEHDENLIPWIKLEMNGYESGGDCPEYRRVQGVPIAINAYNNRLPFTIESRDLREAISKMPVPNLISALEDLIKNSKESIYLSYPEGIQDDFSKLTEADVRFALMVPSYSITTILDIVKGKLLDWVIILSAKEGYSSEIIPSDIIFPQDLISRLPNDIKVLADDFNFNFSHNRADACMLILRRMLPLSIVKKFQEDGQEEIIKKGNDYLDTMPLLAKATHLITKRCYKDIVSYKKFLDASQHSYTFSPEISDVLQVATTLRLLLDELFPNMENKVR